MLFSGVKEIAIPEGKVKSITSGGVLLWKGGYTNLLPLAINSDGTPYVGTNGEKGYKVGWRVNSSNVEKESASNCMTGYIAVKAGQTIRVKNTQTKTGNGYFHWYDSNFAVCRQAYFEITDASPTYNTKPNADGIIEFNAPTESPALAYFRHSTGVISDESIYTVDEEII